MRTPAPSLPVSLPRLKPRNRAFPAALLRKAGAHGKTRKAERRAAKVAMIRGVFFA